MKGKNTKKIILFSVLGILIAGIVTICICFDDTVKLVFNWDNITSFINSQRYSREEIEGQMQENKKQMEKIAEEDPNINIRGDLTEEETKALNEGRITKEDAVALVMGTKTLEEILTPSEDSPDNTPEEDPRTQEDAGAEDNPDNSTGNGSDSPTDNQTDTGPRDNSDNQTDTRPRDNPDDKTETKPQNNTTGKTDSSGNTTGSKHPSKKEDAGTKPPQEEEKTDRPSEIIAELYVIQADFIARLEAMGDRAYEQYKDLHYDRSKITSIIEGFTGEVTALETECDNKVKALLTELEAELKKVGGDTAVVSEIRKYYYTEKSLKKTYYLNKLNDEDYK